MASLQCPNLWEEVLSQLKPNSILDVGCGTGKAIEYFVDHGVSRVFGLEGSPLAIRKTRHPNLIKQWNLNRPLDLNERFDLVWSFEVAEHIHSLYAQTFINTLITHGDLIVLSAAPPGQGGHRHWNEQPQSYWKALFNQYGYDFDMDLARQFNQIPDPLCENIMVFRNKVRR